jgi:hypothetical protein
MYNKTPRGRNPCKGDVKWGIITALLLLSRINGDAPRASMIGGGVLDGSRVG